MIKICFSDVSISLGSMIEEAQKNGHFQKQPCAKARELIVLKWAMIGFLLTISYKSVLLSKLLNIEYEKGFDSIDDVLRSKKPVVLDVATGMVDLMKSDPRENVKEIGKMIKPFKSEKGAPPTWVIRGYSKLQ